MSVTSSPIMEHAPDQVTFVVVSRDGQTRKYKAEKRKLASVSQVFDVLFRQLPPDTREHHITITKFSPRAFKLMLRHVFEKPYVLDDWELALELYCIADKYRINSLQLICEDYFEKTPVTSANALEVFKLATKYDVPAVTAVCDEVFMTNLGDVLLKSNFIHTDKDIVKKMMRHMNKLKQLPSLALINWALHKCREERITCSAANVEHYLVKVCKPAVAISVSNVLAKLLHSMKREPAVSTKNESVEQISLQKSKNVTVHLDDTVSGTIMSAFNVDIICGLEIVAFRGTLMFTGIQLHLKPPSSSEDGSLEIFYSTENPSAGITGSETKVNKTVDKRTEITFLQGLIVKPGQCAVITVRIEDLKMNRCLKNSEQQQVFINEADDIHFRLNFSSNQASSDNLGPFFIERLFYKLLK